MVDIAARVITTFPANVYGENGVTVNKVNGAFYIGYDFDVYWNATGDILVRGADGNPQALTPGPSGYVMTSKGLGFLPEYLPAPGGEGVLPNPGTADTLLVSDGATWFANGVPSSFPRSTSVGGVSSITLTTAYAFSQCTVDTYNGGVNSQQEIVVTLPSAVDSGQGAMISFVKSQAGPTGSDHAGLMTITDGGSFSTTSSLPGDVQTYRSNGASWTLIGPSLQYVRGNYIRSHRTVTTTPYTTKLADLGWILRVITSSNGGYGSDGVVNLPAPTSISIGYLGWSALVTNIADGEGWKVTIDAGPGQSINRQGQTYVLDGDFQTVTLYTDGSEWFVLTDTASADVPFADVATTRAGISTTEAVNPAGLEAYNGNRFQATHMAAVVPVVNTWTKIPIDAEDFDPDDVFDSVTNYRFTPQVAGWYMVWGAASINADDGAVTGIRFYQNGSPRPAFTLKPGGDGAVNLQGFAVIQLNGSTDYLEFFGYSSNTASPSITNSTFGAYRISP